MIEVMDACTQRGSMKKYLEEMEYTHVRGY